MEPTNSFVYILSSSSSSSCSSSGSSSKRKRWSSASVRLTRGGGGGGGGGGDYNDIKYDNDADETEMIRECARVDEYEYEYEYKYKEKKRRVQGRKSRQEQQRRQQQHGPEQKRRRGLVLDRLSEATDPSWFHVRTLDEFREGVRLAVLEALDLAAAQTVRDIHFDQDGVGDNDDDDDDDDAVSGKIFKRSKKESKRWDGKKRIRNSTRRYDPHSVAKLLGPPQPCGAAMDHAATLSTSSLASKFKNDKGIRWSDLRRDHDQWKRRRHCGQNAVSEIADQVAMTTLTTTTTTTTTALEETLNVLLDPSTIPRACSTPLLTALLRAYVEIDDDDDNGVDVVVAAVAAAAAAGRRPRADKHGERVAVPRKGGGNGCKRGGNVGGMPHREESPSEEAIRDTILRLAGIGKGICRRNVAAIESASAAVVVAAAANALNASLIPYLRSVLQLDYSLTSAPLTSLSLSIRRTIKNASDELDKSRATKCLLLAKSFVSRLFVLLLPPCRHGMEKGGGEKWDKVKREDEDGLQRYNEVKRAVASVAALVRGIASACVHSATELDDMDVLLLRFEGRDNGGDGDKHVPTTVRRQVDIRNRSALPEKLMTYRLDLSDFFWRLASENVITPTLSSSSSLPPPLPFRPPPIKPAPHAIFTSKGGDDMWSRRGDYVGVGTLRGALDEVLRMPLSGYARLCAALIAEELGLRKGYLPLLDGLWGTFLSSAAASSGAGAAEAMMMTTTTTAAAKVMDTAEGALRAYVEIIVECWEFNKPETCWLPVRRLLDALLDQPPEREPARADGCGGGDDDDNDDDDDNCKGKVRRSRYRRRHQYSRKTDLLLRAACFVLSSRRGYTLGGALWNRDVERAQLQADRNMALLLSYEGRIVERFYLSAVGGDDGSGDGDDDDADSCDGATGWGTAHAWPFPPESSMREAAKRMAGSCNAARSSSCSFGPSSARIEARAAGLFTDLPRPRASWRLRHPSFPTIADSSPSSSSSSSCALGRDAGGISSRVCSYGAGHVLDAPINECLGDDALLSVFAFLTVGDLAVVAAVCRLWKGLMGANVLWREKYLQRFRDATFPECFIPSDAGNETARSMARDHLEACRRFDNWKAFFEERCIAERSILGSVTRSSYLVHVCNVVGCNYVVRSERMKAPHLQMHRTQVLSLVLEYSLQKKNFIDDVRQARFVAMPNAKGRTRVEAPKAAAVTSKTESALSITTSSTPRHDSIIRRSKKVEQKRKCNDSLADARKKKRLASDELLGMNGHSKIEDGNVPTQHMTERSDMKGSTEDELGSRGQNQTNSRPEDFSTSALAILSRSWGKSRNNGSNMVSAENVAAALSLAVSLLKN